MMMMMMMIMYRIAAGTAKPHEHIVDVESLHDLVRVFFVRGKRFAHLCDMCIVPRVVINQHCSIRHCCQLITVFFKKNKIKMKNNFSNIFFFIAKKNYP